MNREEFDRECEKINDNYDPSLVTSEMFSDINFVYTWYPTISETEGKKQIAYLYLTFGFAIIQDMYDRAKEALSLTESIRSAQAEVDVLKKKLVKLTSGTCNKLDRYCWS